MPNYPNKSVHYLRLNGNAVMQCIVYLDNKHLDWFNRSILNSVIGDIRKLYMPKLLAELNSGKAELDTYRNEGGLMYIVFAQPNLTPHTGYQFAYYYKPTRDKQGILSKNRQVTYVPSSKRTVQQQPKEGDEDLFIDDDDAEYEEKPKPKINTSFKMNKLFWKTLCVSGMSFIFITQISQSSDNHRTIPIAGRIFRCNAAAHYAIAIS